MSSTGRGDNEITSVGYNYCYDSRSHAVAAISVARVAQQGGPPHYSPPRGEAEQRRQPASRSARPFDNMRDEPSGRVASAGPRPQKVERPRRLLHLRACRIFFVSNLTPESLYSVYRHGSQQTEAASMLIKSRVSRIPSCIHACGARRGATSA